MAYRTISRAVDRLFDIASDKQAQSLHGMVEAVERERGRPLQVVTAAKLPAGVFGQWIRYPDRDEVSVADWVHAPDRTIAHELGHIALGHVGRTPLAFAEAVLPPSSQGFANLMLERTCTDIHDRQEAAAEWFAGLLLDRLRGGARSPKPAVRSRLREALG